MLSFPRRISLVIPRIITNLTSTMEPTIIRAKENSANTKAIILELRDELKVLYSVFNTMKAKQLQEENAVLVKAVETAKSNLIELEKRNGVKQIALPNEQRKFLCGTTVPSQPAVKEVTKADNDAKTTKKAEKKPKEKKESVAKPPSSDDLPVDIGRLDLRIGMVEDVQRHPDADSLYVLKINCGEEKVRTVCSGLVKFIPLEQLTNRSVVVLCNLKPAKMRGITSEAMVMCASTPDKVEVLIPPAGVVPGDFVTCDGYARSPDSVMNPKKKIFETVAPDLHTNDGLVACYKGIPWQVIGKGNVLATTLKNVIVK